MKKENTDYKIGSEKFIKESDDEYNEDPEFSQFSLDPANLINNRQEINNESSRLDNWNIDLNFSTKLTNLKEGLDAKIKHRKKREGD
ncbi:MAG: hypothetical protein ACFE91_08190 [Promethearchaeota archaeon]